jgi:hypothetical protein
LVEWALGRWYEGPEPPRRLVEHVIEFTNDNPNANRGEWIRFARTLAAESYKLGWSRGYEYAERGDQFRDVDPETHADILDPGWRDRGAVRLEYDALDAVQAIDEIDVEDIYRR